MKYRFGVEFEFNGSAEEAGNLLHIIIQRGASAFGHNQTTLPIFIEKLRLRSLNPDKPVGEQE